MHVQRGSAAAWRTLTPTRLHDPPGIPLVSVVVSTSSCFRHHAFPAERVYDPNRGRVLLDSVELPLIDHAWLHGQVGGPARPAGLWLGAGARCSSSFSAMAP